MSTNLSDTRKAVIFSVLVVILAVGAASLIRMQGHVPGPGLWAVWMFTPTMATLIMLLVVTREGYSKEGWKSLGLHRLGLNVWWIAFGMTLLITVAATAFVWATPLASFVIPEGGILATLLDFVFKVAMFTLTFTLGEEIGWRGYLLPKLLPLGRNRALVLVGLVWAPWHLVLLFLTSFFPMGNVLIFVPLFVGTIVAASFFFGYLRLYTASVWPASIGHSVHNAAWDTLDALTVTSSPVLVNLYLVGDNGILILVATILGAIWVGRMLRSGMNEAQPVGAVPKATPSASAR